MATKKASSKAAKKATKKSARKSAKKAARKSTKRSSGSGAACWPGFKRVPGTKAGAKGSCEPKAKQTGAEKKAEARAAAARKRERGQE